MKLEFEIKIEDARDLARIVGMAVVATALIQELRKPPNLRAWRGEVAGVVPYDFRPPTLERIRDAYWNPDNPELFVPTAFGAGWGINIPTLSRNLGRLIQDAFGELRGRMKTP